MPSFQNNEKITLQPRDRNLNKFFEITICSSATSNDGFLANGRSVTSVGVSGFKEDKTTLAPDLVQSSSLLANVVTVVLSYPGVSGAGNYSLLFSLVLDDGGIKEADFNRIYAEEV